MSVAAQLHHQAAVGPGGEVGGHHRGRTAVIAPWRGRHAAVADRHQVRCPHGVLSTTVTQGVMATPSRFHTPASVRDNRFRAACPSARRSTRDERCGLVITPKKPPLPRWHGREPSQTATPVRTAQRQRRGRPSVRKQRQPGLPGVGGFEHGFAVSSDHNFDYRIYGVHGVGIRQSTLSRRAAP